MSREEEFVRQGLDKELDKLDVFLDRWVWVGGCR